MTAAVRNWLTAPLNAVVVPTCGYCGKTLPATDGRRRKYCSVACRTRNRFLELAKASYKRPMKQVAA